MKSNRLMAMILIAGLLGMPSLTAPKRLFAAPTQVPNAPVVNVNKASVEELQSVRGIGPKLAERIIKYRQDKGKFSRLEDLLEVNGIGEAKFEKIKNQVSI